MAKPKKRKLRVKQRAQVRKKGEGGSIKKAPTRLAPDVAANIRVKIKKKNG